MTEFEKLEHQCRAAQSQVMDLTIVRTLDGTLYVAVDAAKTCWKTTQEECDEWVRRFHAMEGPPFIRELRFTDSTYHILDYRVLECPVLKVL